ncbi:PaaI family thioesterase [Marinihelvus fidelis]|nr:PaaI family thioesterase [Marinihelvus fidelis]
MKQHDTDAMAIQDHYDPDFQVCYGCGARNDKGLHLKSYIDGDRVVAEYLPQAHEMGVPGVAYGGLIASLIDCHGIATGAAHFLAEYSGHPPRCVTASLHVEYRAPTPIDGTPMTLTARVTDSSARKAVVEVQVYAGGTLTAEGRVVAVRYRG